MNSKSSKSSHRSKVYKLVANKLARNKDPFDCIQHLVELELDGILKDERDEEEITQLIEMLWLVIEYENVDNNDYKVSVEQVVKHLISLN